MAIENENKKKILKCGEAGNVLQSILSETVWAMEPGALHQFMMQVHQNLIAKSETSQEMFSFSDDEDEGKKPYRMENGIAVFEIRGRLMKRASGFIAWLLGIKGMEAIGKDFKQAMLDPGVKGIFLDVDSPGGSADGTFDLADIVYAGRGQKPIMAFADGHMTSAAMAIGSSADFVVAANEITSMGSIGVYGVHFDYADRAKEMGIKPTVFSAGKYKAIGNEFEHLSASDKKYIQETFDHSHEQFINLMSRNMGIPVGEMDGDLKEAKVFMGSQAIAVGLADAVMAKDKAISLLSDVAEGKTTFEKHKSMSQITLQGGVNNMANEQELTTKIADLETKLQNAQAMIAELSGNKVKTELESQVAAITAEKDGLAAKLTETETAKKALETEAAGLKQAATENQVFIAAGKASFDNARADIHKLSAQVDGESYDKALVDKQLTAFGNDMEAIGSFKKNLESRRAKMLKAGEIVPDEPKGDGTKPRTEAQQYELGTKIVPARLQVVK